MRYILTETQSDIYKFIRRINTPEMKKVFDRLVLESTWANSTYLSKPFEVYLDRVLSWAAYNIVAQDDHVLDFGYEFYPDDEKVKVLIKYVYDILASKYTDEIHESYKEKLYER